MIRFTALGCRIFIRKHCKLIHSWQCVNLAHFTVSIYGSTTKWFYFVEKCLLEASWECLRPPCSFFGLLESEGVSNEPPTVPSVQHFLSGVIVHHGVVAILVYKLYVRVPLFSCLGVISKVDSGGIGAIVVNTVDYSTGYKSIAYVVHWFCEKRERRTLDQWMVRKSESQWRPLHVPKSYEYDSEWNIILVFRSETYSWNLFTRSLFLRMSNFLRSCFPPRYIR